MIDPEDIAARRELIRSLFALLTTKLENAAAKAANGQAVAMASDSAIDLANRLYSAGQEAMILADAIVGLVETTNLG